jgi:hypothetical protein
MAATIAVVVRNSSSNSIATRQNHRGVRRNNSGSKQTAGTVEITASILQALTIAPTATMNSGSDSSNDNGSDTGSDNSNNSYQLPAAWPLARSMPSRVP